MSRAPVMKLLALAGLVLGSACRSHAAAAVDCEEDMHRLSMRPRVQRPGLWAQPTRDKARPAAGTVAVVDWTPLFIPFPSPARGPLPKPQVWVGCGEVALCPRGPDEDCQRADWLKPGSLPGLMARSAANAHADLGISDCGEGPPSFEPTGLNTWDLFVCGETARCYVVLNAHQYECRRGTTPPDDVSPMRGPPQDRPAVPSGI